MELLCLTSKNRFEDIAEKSEGFLLSFESVLQHNWARHIKNAYFKYY